MLLTVRHETHYRYHRPVGFGRHRLVLRPREGHDLAVTRHRLLIQPAHRLTWIRDVHGNVVALVDFLETASELSIVNDVGITRTAAFPERGFHAPFQVPWPPVYDPLEAAPAEFFGAAVYAEERARVRQWLDETFEPDPEDAEGAVLALCRQIHTRIDYRRRHEKGVQSPQQTLDLRSGSCRDMATLLMEAARASGLAARFASGYLHGTASMAGHASTHAWAEVYLPLLGWRGFDPTIGAAVDVRHIVTGVSHHPRGVMPVSGTFDGVGADFAGLTVTVHTAEHEEAIADS